MTIRPRLIVISGLPGSGKSTVGRLLAESLERAAYIEADVLQHFVVAGLELADHNGISDEGRQQLSLRLRNACLLAKSYVASGFTAVVDDIVTGRRFEELVTALGGTEFEFVMLNPDFEVMKARWRRMGSPFAESWDWIDEEIQHDTPRIGLWIDSTHLTPDETLARIISGLDLEVAATS